MDRLQELDDQLYALHHDHVLHGATLVEHHEDGTQSRGRISSTGHGYGELGLWWHNEDDRHRQACLSHSSWNFSRTGNEIRFSRTGPDRRSFDIPPGDVNLYVITIAD